MIRLSRSPRTVRNQADSKVHLPLIGGMAIAFFLDVQSSPTIEWTMTRGHARVECVRRDTDDGVELSVLFAGLRTAQFLAKTMDEARSRVDEIRRSWEAVGYAAA